MPAELARTAARRLGVVASVTGPVDHVSDGERVLAISNGHELLGTVTGTGCMSSALTGCFLAAKPGSRSRRPPRRSQPSASRRRMPQSTRAGRARSTPVSTTRSYALDPMTLDGRTRIEEL